MKKYNLLNSLLIFALIIGAGCDRPPLEPGSSRNSPKLETQEQSVKPSVIATPAFGDRLEGIKTSGEELKSSLNQLNAQIGNFVTGQINQNDINLDELTQSISDFRSSLASFNNELSQIEQSKSNQIKQNLEELEALVANIETVYLPLSEGLDSAKIETAQRALGMQLGEGEYGNLGDKTFQQLEEFHKLKTTDLTETIALLEEEVKALDDNQNLPSTLPDENLNSLGNEERLVIAREEIDSLRQQVSSLKSSVTRLNLFLSLISFISLVAIAGATYIIYHQGRKIKTSLKKGVNFASPEIAEGDRIEALEQDFYEYSERMKRCLQEVENKIYFLETAHRTEQGEAPSFSGDFSRTKSASTQSFQGTLEDRSASGRSQADFSSETRIIATYNNNARSFERKVIPVSESLQTVEQRRAGKEVRPILEKDNQGNYWIIEEGQGNYLVPKARLKLNEHNFKTIAVFFNCSGEMHSGSQIYLQKPARVSRVAKEQWELIEPGELHF